MPLIDAIYNYFLNLAIIVAVVKLLSEASVKSLSAWLKKIPYANELIRTSGDTFMFNPMIALAHTSNVFPEVKKTVTIKMITSPIFAFASLGCVAAFFDNLITYSVMVSFGHVTSDEALEAVLFTPSVFVFLICIIAPIVINAVFSKKNTPKMVLAYRQASIADDTYTESYAEPAPEPTPAATTYYKDDGDVNSAFGGSKNQK